MKKMKKSALAAAVLLSLSMMGSAYATTMGTSVSAGQKINFGNYWQSATSTSGNKEAVAWRVLADNGNGTVTLLSDKGLYACGFDGFFQNSNMWTNSYIETKLNNTIVGQGFMGDAFTTAEQGLIVAKTYDVKNEKGNKTEEGVTSKLYLLDYNDVKDWSNDERKAQITTFAQNATVYGNYDPAMSNSCWWLRSPDSSSDLQAWSVSAFGTIVKNGVDMNADDIVVRPALDLNLGDVIYTSAAGGKSNALETSGTVAKFGAIGTNSVVDVTVEDKEHTYTNAVNATLALDGGNVKMKLSGGKMSDEQHFASAMFNATDSSETAYSVVKKGSAGGNPLDNEEFAFDTGTSGLNLDSSKSYSLTLANEYALGGSIYYATVTEIGGIFGIDEADGSSVSYTIDADDLLYNVTVGATNTLILVGSGSSDRTITNNGTVKVQGFANVGEVEMGEGAKVNVDGQLNSSTVVSVGMNNTIEKEGAVAIGSGITVSGENSVAVGNGSVAAEDNVVSVGRPALTDGTKYADDTDTAINRKIVNVAAGTIAEGSTDAVNGGQLYDAIQNAGGGTGGTTYTAGENVTISDAGVISATDTKYTAGNANIAISNDNKIALSSTLTGLESAAFSGAVTAASMTVGSVSISGGKIGGFTSGGIANGDTFAVTGGTVYTALQNYATKTDLGGYAQLSGANFTGAVTSTKGTGKDDFNSNEFVTKGWVLANAGGGTGTGTGGTGDAYSKNETDNLLDAKANADDVYAKTETYSKAEVNDELAKKANVTDVYTKAQTDEKLAGKADKATTLQGYGITDAYSKTETNTLLDAKANAADVYTKTQVDTALGNKANTADVYAKTETYSKAEVNDELAKKADKATTLAGYGITDSVTKSQVENMITNAELGDVISGDKTSFGTNSTATGSNATAVGSGNTVSGESSTAIGNGLRVYGKGSGAFGDPTVVIGDNDYSVGNNNYITANDTFVLGSGVGTETNPLTAANSVVLGNNSFATVIPEVDGKNGVVSVGADGNERRITNVRDGVLASDAATVGQVKGVAGELQGEINTLNGQIDRMGTHINKVGAGAAALAAMHPVYDEDSKLTFSAGMGAYRNEKAAAVGMFFRFSPRVMMNAGATVGNDNNMYNVGLNFALDRHVRGGLPSKAIMAKQLNSLTLENSALKEKLATMDAKMVQQGEQIAQLMAMIEELRNK